MRRSGLRGFVCATYPVCPRSVAGDLQALLRLRLALREVAAAVDHRRVCVDSPLTVVVREVRGEGHILEAVGDGAVGAVPVEVVRTEHGSGLLGVRAVPDVVREEAAGEGRDTEDACAVPRVIDERVPDEARAMRSHLDAQTAGNVRVN